MLSTSSENKRAKTSWKGSAMPCNFAMRNCEEAIEPPACQKQREKEKEREKEKKREISESLHPRPNLLSSFSWLYVAWNPRKWNNSKMALKGWLIVSYTDTVNWYSDTDTITDTIWDCYNVAYCEPIVNPRTHCESRSIDATLWIPEPIVNPGTFCESKHHCESWSEAMELLVDLGGGWLSAWFHWTGANESKQTGTCRWHHCSSGDCCT